MGKTQDIYLIPIRTPLWLLPVDVLIKIMVGTIVTKKFLIGFLAREDMAPGCWP